MEELATIFNVEADETYIGGLEMNKHESKKLKSGRGNVGKTPVTGIKDWQTNQIRTQVAERTNKATLQDFVVKNTEDEAIVYTDEHAAYTGLPRYHEALVHGAGEYVRNMAHTNGRGSHWSLFKQGIDGVYRRGISPCHGEALGAVQQRIQGTP